MNPIAGLEMIHRNYDAFLVDAWGVLHDGVQCYSGVMDCLQHLIRLPKPVIVLSNAARREHAIGVELARLGISTDMYHSVVSSGELCWQTLNSESLTMELGELAYYFGPERSRSLCEGLSFQWVDTPGQADFVLNTGAPFGNPADAAILIPQLEPMLEKDLPMICANPDQVAVRGGELGISAGAIAKLYQSLGGRHVIYYGKPQFELFQLAADRLKNADKSRLLMVGDAFETDIAGAVNYGIDSLLITGGIHADKLASGDIESVNRTAQEYAVKPTYFCQNFCW
jgi:HAD superfamily hydrolase (TIGR01459 family)